MGSIPWTWPLVGAVLVLVCFFLTAPSLHSFWRFDGKERANQKRRFLGNVALVGAAIVFLGDARIDE